MFSSLLARLHKSYETDFLEIWLKGGGGGTKEELRFFRFDNIVRLAESVSYYF